MWNTIDTAPKCVASSENDNGRRPVLVTFWPPTGHHAPVAVARLTRDGWVGGRKGTKLWFKPTHWMEIPEVSASTINP